MSSPFWQKLTNPFNRVLRWIAEGQEKQPICRS